MCTGWWEPHVGERVRCAALALDVANSSRMCGPFKKDIQRRVDEILRGKGGLVGAWSEGDAVMALFEDVAEAVGAAHTVKHDLSADGVYARQGIHVDTVRDLAADVAEIRGTPLDHAGHLRGRDNCPSGGIQLSQAAYDEYMDSPGADPELFRKVEGRDVDRHACFLHPADMIDIVVPVGPFASDAEKVFPFSALVPKAALPVGGVPLLWHTLGQLASIGHDRIGTVFLVFANPTPSNTESDNVRRFLRYMWTDPRLPLAAKISADEPETGDADEPVCGRIAALRKHCLSHAVMVHYDDVLLEPSAPLLLQMVECYFSETCPNGSDGLLACSPQHPLDFGVVFAGDPAGSARTQRIVIQRMEEKDSQTIGRLTLPTVLTGDLISGLRAVHVNMAISLFKRSILQKFSSRKDDLFRRVADLIDKGGITVELMSYSGRWEHLDSAREIRDAAREEAYGFWRSQVCDGPPVPVSQDGRLY